MPKAKSKLTIRELQKGLGTQTHPQRSKINLDLSIKKAKDGIIIGTKLASQKLHPSRMQEKQILRFKYCDCVYRILKNYPQYLITWFNEQASEEEKKEKVRSKYMKDCLMFNLGVLLEKYLKLKLMPITLEEREEDIVIKTKVIATKELEPHEDFYLPNQYRYTR
ncbi:MAG: hypothetical protein QXO33_04135 [Nitrososphaeria archaeon]